MWLLAWLGCTQAPPLPPEPVAPPPSREDFNRLAADTLTPWFWSPTEGPDKLIPLWQGGGLPRPVDGLPTLAPLDPDPRQQALLAELHLARPTLVRTDVTPAERPFVEAMLAVGQAIESLHAAQRGVTAIRPASDGPSRALFFRNQGPWCVTPDPACTATTEPTPVIVGVYPKELQADKGFCSTLDDSLLSPFTAVRAAAEGALEAIPYSRAWPNASTGASKALLDAAATLPAEELALATYLRAAAQAFTDDNWVAADEAWLKTRNQSAWYVRVAADETYWDPCDRKAGYHLVFARINPASEKWLTLLEPHKQSLEALLAEKAAPYKARKVEFSLPEFIDIVLNAGDARQAVGATIGQSLPNWGPVAEAGGRTVAMTNLNNDDDSRAALRSRAESLFCALDHYTDDPEPLLLSTVLHEAAHNLGPAAGYTIEGKTDEALFGGELSSMLEELKAQTAALRFTDWLAEHDVIAPEMAQQAHMADLLWSFGKIADGMNAPDGGALAYPRLSAIQIGELRRLGAITWHPEQAAANGTDRGCLSVDHGALSAAIDTLANDVLAIKGAGKVDAAQLLVTTHVDGLDPAWATLVRERWNRAPQNTFVYGFRFLDQ